MYQAPWQKKDNQNILESTFTHYGITGWDRWNFSQFNLVTGENGAGKSRLLRAIRDVCQEAGISCIYMDFTEIGKPGMVHQKSVNATDMANPLLYHGRLPKDAYKNFIPFIEKNTEAFSEFLFNLSPSDEKLIMGERRRQINEFLQNNLGRKLCFEKNDLQCRITSREENRSSLPFTEAVKEMSPGEKCILYFALGVLCAKADEGTSGQFVLLLDEPENHLHPKVLISLIQEILSMDKVKRSGHVLVASHSIFLIPLFSFDEILFVQKSKISPATSAIYSNAYQALIGDPEAEGGGLRELLSSLSHWNYSNYLTECLCAPTTSDREDRNDPEFKKLLDALRPLEKKDKIKLLDYGGGSGRIAKCMNLHFQAEPNDPLIQRLTYEVYDPYIDRDTLPNKSWMGRTYGKDEHNQLLPESYDLVVLYNVLHEVDVTEWADTLNDIFALLKDDGILVFGERMVLSQGERPYGRSGYLVLDHSELEELFGADHVGEPIKWEGEKKDPTICCAIKNPRSIKVMESNVTEAIKKLSERSKRAINSYIDEGVEANKSRKYAFYCQQYINAEHAVALLGNQKTLSNILAMDLQYIISTYNWEERTVYLKERAEINDEEGRKCKEWLELHSIT